MKKKTAMVQSLTVHKKPCFYVPPTICLLEGEFIRTYFEGILERTRTFLYSWFRAAESLYRTDEYSGRHRFLEHDSTQYEIPYKVQHPLCPLFLRSASYYV